MIQRFSLMTYYQSRIYLTYLKYFLELKANFSKCEITGLGSLKGVLEAVCSLKSISLTTYTIKILGGRFSLNGIVKVQNNFLDTVKSIQQVFRFWNSRMLSLEGKIIIFKTLTISKIVYLTFLTVIPNSLIEELQKIQKTFIWHSSRPKISNKTLCNNFENDGLKHVDISSKIISLQCSWLRKLCDENFHEWKIITFHVINKYLRKSFKFHSCIFFDRKLLIKFSEFYRNILLQWSSSLFASSELPSCILSTFIWFNKHILIEKKPIFFCYFSDKGLNFVYQLFDYNGNVNTWSSIKEEFSSNNFSNSIWQQLIYLLPPSLFKQKTFYVSKINVTSLSFLQTF